MKYACDWCRGGGKIEVWAGSLLNSLPPMNDKPQLIECPQCKGTGEIEE